MLSTNGSSIIEVYLQNIVDKYMHGITSEDCEHHHSIELMDRLQAARMYHERLDSPENRTCRSDRVIPACFFELCMCLMLKL